jgi:hypothetical protein
MYVESRPKQKKLKTFYVIVFRGVSSNPETHYTYIHNIVDLLRQCR